MPTAQYKYTSGTLLFKYERIHQLLISVLQHEERDTVLSMLTILYDPNQCASHLVVFKILVGRDLQNSNYMPQR